MPNHTNRINLSDRKAYAIVADVSRKHGVSPYEVIGTSKYGPTALARQEAYARLYEMGASLTRIGEVLKRDHSTVLVGIRRYKERTGNAAA